MGVGVEKTRKNISLIFARVVELADTLDSGSSGRKVVQVQILSRALFLTLDARRSGGIRQIDAGAIAAMMPCSPQPRDNQSCRSARSSTG